MRSILQYCGDLPQRTFAPGESLLDEGTTAGVLYVLVSGAVEILKGSFQVNVVTEPGALFGEVSVLLAVPHMATVKALEPTTVYVIADAPAFLRSRSEIALCVATLLAKRLRSVTTYLVDLKTQFGDNTDHLGMVDEVLESLVHSQDEGHTPGSDRDPDPLMD